MLVNQQVTIGYSGSEHPILEDNVYVHCGAKVLGGITMHNNSVAGANAVVTKDVPGKCCGWWGACEDNKV